METLNTLLCFYDMSNSSLAVEKLEDVYEYIVGSSFDEMYIIRKIKAEKCMFKNYQWNEKVRSGDIRKTVAGCAERRGSRF